MNNTIDYGTVHFEGKELTITQAAYCDNYSTDGAVRYYATATDSAGNSYQVAWETTQEWNSGEVDTEDESNSCDWDNPIEVKKQ